MRTIPSNIYQLVAEKKIIYHHYNSSSKSPNTFDVTILIR